jgi:predicted transcriptional regulator
MTMPDAIPQSSYGGQIVTALGTDAPNAVGLVYIAGFGIDEGESLGVAIGSPDGYFVIAERPDGVTRSFKKIHKHLTLNERVTSSLPARSRRNPPDIDTRGVWTYFSPSGNFTTQ